MYLMSLTVASPSVDCVLLVFQKAARSWCDLGSAGSSGNWCSTGVCIHRGHYFKIRGSLKNWETLPLLFFIVLGKGKIIC